MRPDSETATVHAIRFDALEGMRGLLAWWVVLGHLVQNAGLSPKEIPYPFDFIRMAMHPVYVFMVMSGFVIAHLVVTRNESYPIYIFRRYVRLAPVMILGMALSAIIALSGDRFNFPRTNYAEHALLHVSLLHGLVPDNVLRNASTSFIGPAWSISLEWQFYLVAPVLIKVIHENRRGALLCAVIIAALILSGLPSDLRSLGDLQYRKPSLFLTTFPLFITGILAYLATRIVGSRNGDSPAFLVGIVLAALWPPLFIPKFGWVVTFGTSLMVYAIIYRDSVISQALASKPLTYLGKISYSTYLLHFPIVLLIAEHTPRPENDWLALLEFSAIAAPLILLLSAGSYLLVEKPCIEWAARKVKSWKGSAPAAPA